MKALAFALTVIAATALGANPSRAAPCSYNNPSACGSPGMNQMSVANGGVLNGTFSGSPNFSGSVTFSGSLLFTGLGTGTQVSCLGLDSSNHVVLATGACGSGGGGTPANPTATAGPVAVNGSATTYMRSDAAPAIQKGSNAQFGIVEGDGTTLTCIAGVCSSIGGVATSITPGTTTVVGATAPCIIENTGTTVMGCIAETGTGSFVRATSPTLVTPALGTPASGVATNLTGTAAGLTAGTATAANGLKSATTTVAVSAATAPTTGQVLTATGASTATWQTVSSSATSVTPGTTTVVGATAPCVLENTATTVLGCTAETGTGSFVRATSPTLVTPVLGTPSALTLTNATGLPNAGLATQTANTVLGALTATTPSGLALPSCSGSTNALIWTSGSGFGCNTITGGSATTITPGTTTVSGAAAPCVIENTGTTVMGCTAETGTGSFVRATSPTLVTPALGTPASGVATNLTGTAASLTAGIATAANGLKSATTTVAVSAATAPTSGQVLTATGGSAATWQTPGSGTVSITSLTPNIVVAPSPITGTGTVSSTVPLNTQTGASYAILTGDNTQVIEMTNASATTMTIPVANSAGFLSGWGTSVMPTLAATTITPASGTIGGQATLTLQPGQFASIAAGSGTNYDVALGIPPSIPSGTIASGKNIGLDSSNRLVTATVGGGAASITPGTTTIVGSTAPCLIENSTSTTMACAAVTAGNVTALGVATGSAGAPVLFNGAGGTPSSMTGTNITGIPNAAVAAAPLPTPGTSATLVAPRSYYVCTGTCTVTVPVPAAGMEFCIMNDDNVSTVITMAAIGSSARYENTARTAYGTAGTGTFVSGGAVGDKVCLLGRDSTHYLTVSFNGTWTAN